MPTSTGTGVLEASPATLGSVGGVVHAGVGTLLAVIASLAGVGNIGPIGTGTLVASSATLESGGGWVSNTGQLYADYAFISAAGDVGHPGAGTLVAGSATLAGIGNAGDTGQLIAGPATITAAGVHGFTAILNLAAFPATLNGVGQLEIQGTGNLVAGSAQASGVGGFINILNGTVPFNPGLSGAFPVTAYLRGIVPFSPTLTGNFRTTESAQASLEAGYEDTGYRPSLPILVYVLHAYSSADVNNAVPDNRYFLVSASFAGLSGNSFYDSGASPDYIGTKVVPTTGSSYFVFRRPRSYEAVWHVPTRTLYRYELNRDTARYNWVLYKGVPERGWEGQYVGSIFDPDKVLTYYSRILTATMWRWTYDTEVLGEQLDPYKASKFYLSALGAQYGLTLDAEASVEVNRSLVANAVASFKKKGVNEGVRIRLQAVGFRAFVNEIWVNPTNLANAAYFASVPLNRAGDPSCGPLGAGVDYYERPHNYHVDDRAPYVLSSRLVVYINNQDGTTFDWAGAPSDLKTRIYNALRADILPVHVDIRHFGTSVPLLGADLSEVIEASDTLTVTPI